MARVETSCWDEHLDEFMAQVGPHFARPQTCARARSVIGALIGDLPRKNAWTLAECVGEASPHGVQHLLGRAVWDEDGVAVDLRSFVVFRLGRPGGILVVDETGDCKKGNATVGVQRQYTGTAGRIENAQVGVYLGYATGCEHALIDRELGAPPVRSVGETYRSPGPRIGIAAPRLVSPSTSPSRPSRRWPQR